jgi:peptidoglycan/xylan/chitin deacetylase (PgdA/CDA1 family)
VALTFDAEHPDRPAVANGTEAVLDVLAEHRTPATFFLQGRWVEAFPEVAVRIRDGDHLIGNHSHYHARMHLFSASGFETDVRAAESVIRRRVGVDPRPWFRFPFGSGARLPELQRRLADLGYRNIHWDLEVKEWRTRATARQVEDGVVEGVRQLGGEVVVLLHPWPTMSARALPGIIERLSAARAGFVRVDELGRLPSAPGDGRGVRAGMTAG